MARSNSGAGLRSPAGVCALYCAAAFIVFIIARFIYPDFDGGMPLLGVFWFKARFVRGILTFITLFPAVFIAALMIPFALKVYASTAEKRFSPAFIESLKPQLLLCLIGAVFHALLTLIAAPLLSSYLITASSASRLYTAAREKAELFANDEKWVEASGFFAICERIWVNNEAVSSLEERIAAGLERLRYSRNAGNSLRSTLGALPGEREPLNAMDAVRLAKKALAEERFYDAHWLANAAERLAPEGSVEAAEAARTASLAWNAIARLEPSADEERLFSIYRRKREGYEALVSGEWIRSYYIFVSLKKDAPADPDVQKYFTMSERGLSSVAFFLDEMDFAVGDIQQNALFSLRDRETGGRVVIRIEALTSFENESFGRSLEALGFSERNEPLFRLTAPIVKIMPISINGEWRTVCLLRAVDRENPAIRQEAVWTGKSGGGSTQYLLNIPYEELLLAADAQRGTGGFFLGDFWRAARTLRSSGFAGEVFLVELMRTITEAMLFPALAVFALVIGWTFRARLRVRYALFPMLLVLPLVFYLLGVLARVIVRSVSILSVLSLGTGAAFAIAFGAPALLFAIAVFFLSAQRSGA